MSKKERLVYTTVEIDPVELLTIAVFGAETQRENKLFPCEVHNFVEFFATIINYCSAEPIVDDETVEKVKKLVFDQIAKDEAKAFAALEQC